MIGEGLTIWFFGGLALGAVWCIACDIADHFHNRADERDRTGDEHRCTTWLDLECSWELPAQIPPHERETA